ncbi:MAG: acyl-CoA dehydrogenase family protein [Alphaproteobacteria bacterium]
MSITAEQTAAESPLLDDLLGLTAAALGDAEALLARARARLGPALSSGGKLDPKRLDEEQFAAHAYAWAATYVEAMRQMRGWAERLDADGELGELEQLLVQATYGGYLGELAGGIAMSQVEIARPHDWGLEDDDLDRFQTAPVRALIRRGAGRDARMAIAGHLRDGQFGRLGLDETMTMVREQFHRFSDEKVREPGHQWHLKDELIPMPLVDEMSAMGVFGLTIPETYGGHGMGKTAMCVVSEELSRGYIGVGSLGTRSEIAAELILTGGTEDQKQYWLPKIAAGEILPTAVFTEPNIGSDLANLTTRATREGDVYKVFGNKTWITHAARADLMTLLVRTGGPGYRGLSMLLAPKPRGVDGDAFPAAGMSGGELPVIGYRGMKEYELAFDGFEVPAANLLGGEEGGGFKQLMATFESARIQTAARAVGVAQSALELGLGYATERRQFSRPIADFPRVAGKLAWMATEAMAARQLTYFAAREKDSGRRCDLQAGMAKLLAARCAWAAADNAVQIHGGNGFAMEFPISRVLADARILSIFEGAAEIQAQVIARRLLEQGN